MAEHSTIEWTDATWNPITGCSVVSPGCTNCYAMKLAGTRLRNHRSRAGLTKPTKAGPVWNGVVRLNEGWLKQPMQWKRSRRIFVCAHGDLFHENVPDDWIDQVFAVMALSSRHTFQILTKRPDRMRDYVSRWFKRLSSLPVMVDHPTGRSRFSDLVDWAVFPSILPNVWLGVSAERQEEWDQRKDHLRLTPAAVRFASFEPLLGSIVELNPMSAYLQWAIVGGESGLSSRLMHPSWARSLRDACTKAGVPFFFKQWGEFFPTDTTLAEFLHQSDDRRIGERIVGANDFEGFPAHGVERFQVMRRLGKTAAGRLLDGVEHNGMPRRAA